MQDNIRATHQSFPNHPALETIFFGGGTPSLLCASEMAELISTLASTFGLTPDCEITLEANPNDIDADKAAKWRKAGINRLSVGVQSLDDAALNFLGRDHDADAARRATDIALDVFRSVSIDMIYARPDQTPSEWEVELQAALRLDAQHLSLYELTIEPATPFGKRAARGELLPLPDDDQALLYELTDQITQDAGLPAYEVSNHAKDPGHRSVHNQIYWNSGDWLGIGPGAHGRLTRGRQRFTTLGLARPKDFLSSEPVEIRPLSREETAHEMLAMGLRPARGIERNRIEGQFASRLDSKKLAHLVEGGWLDLSDGRLSLTRSGRLLADRVTLEIAEAVI
jgi:oxygen-independent coproporphyrinogen-3 oxidase